jgi:hypothetical protein
MNQLSDNEISRILELYKIQRERDRVKYEQRKQDPEFMKKNRERAKKHYEENKHNRVNKYSENKDLQKAKSSYHYYKNKDNLDKFKERFPERYELLKGINYFQLNDKKPSLSIKISDDE